MDRALGASNFAEMMMVTMGGARGVLTGKLPRCFSPSHWRGAAYEGGRPLPIVRHSVTRASLLDGLESELAME